MNASKNILLLLALVSSQFVSVNANNKINFNLKSKMIKSENKAVGEIVHNMAHLSEYDLFHSSFNKIIHTAFIINANRFEVTLKTTENIIKKNVEIYYYDYKKTDAFGKFLLNKSKQITFVQSGNKLVFEPAGLDLSKNYVIDIHGERSDIFLDPSIGGILDNVFYAGSISDLGVKFTGNTAVFKVWSPPAGKIVLQVFDKDQKPVSSINELNMKLGEKGLWAYELSASDLKNVKSLDGLYYQYKVYSYGKITYALDPYAKSMATFSPTGEDLIGKGAMISLTNASAIPLKFDNNYKNAKYMANEVDMVAYEAHVRDFTIQPNVINPEIAGTFSGFQKKIGYLKNLGITHVQLLPVQNFYTVNENDRAYKDSDAPKSNYNWGYDPHNYFTPEGWFSTDASNPYLRIREYRELIQSLHDMGIGVIMDVVYNHTYIAETFENIAPGCYYRYDKDLKISGATGAGPSLECRRKMVKKLIIESLKYFVEIYHVDGFRFDLMGFLDHELMEAIRNEVGSVYNKDNTNELILHGEAWVFSDIDTDVKAKGLNAATTKLNYPSKKINLGVFNDSSRDSYTGRELNSGFVQGNISEADRVAAGITGALKGFDAGRKIINTERFRDTYNSFAFSPENCLNYLTIHDGYTLWDKLNLSFKDETKLVRARIMKMANAMLFTSQGKIIMHGGDELLRTKPLAHVDKEKDRAHTSEFVTEEEGTRFFHENTYCSNDFTNMVRWDRMVGDYSRITTSMIDYYKGLITMRRNIPAFRYKNSENLNKGLVFLGAEKNTTEVKQSLFKGFDDVNLKKLNVKFINGPKKQTFFIAGEVHPKGVDANPVKNGFFVDLDETGTGIFEFTREQINNFELTKWGLGNGLNIKLVKSPGLWETLDSSYSGMGNNLITVNGINENFEVMIDLHIKDYAAGTSSVNNDPYLVYMLDNTLENDLPSNFSGTKYTKLIVIHNTSYKTESVSISAIENKTEWNIILDDHNAGIIPLLYVKETSQEKGKTNVLVENGKVLVPGKSSVVLAK